ncbi:MAG: hypothetical protein HKO05_10750, partial [Erythrobacter sp.]|nr:hypothetical protein [Erythrobacter sp.]
AMPMAVTPAQADNHAEAEPKMLEQDWYRVNLVRFKEGKQGRASEIIAMYEKASDAAGQEGPVSVHMNSGPWHLMVFFKMEHGIGEMGWASNPDEAAWDKAFAEIAGGEDQAKKLHDEFSSLIAVRERHIGHIHDDGNEGS